MPSGRQLTQLMPSGCPLAVASRAARWRVCHSPRNAALSGGADAGGGSRAFVPGPAKAPGPMRSQAPVMLGAGVLAVFWACAPTITVVAQVNAAAMRPAVRHLAAIL